MTSWTAPSCRLSNQCPPTDHYPANRTLRFALGLKGPGPDIKLAGSFLGMAIADRDILPIIQGLVVRDTGSLAMGYGFRLSVMRPLPSTVWWKAARMLVRCGRSISLSGKSAGTARLTWISDLPAAKVAGRKYASATPQFFAGADRNIGKRNALACEIGRAHV